MKRQVDNVLFAKVNLPSLDKDQAANEILKLDSSLSFWDEYRYTKMFPLMTKRGRYNGAAGASNYGDGEFYWVPHAPNVIVDWFEKVVFPWVGARARIMALVTEPGTANYEHIDCERDDLNTLQHKLRIVLKGKTSTLYFITKDGNKHAPDVEGAFIMDGGWPHGMINTADEVKVTIAMGAPWVGNNQYGNDIDVLLDRNKFVMPDDLSKYYKKK